MIPSVLKKPGLLLTSIAAMLFVVIASGVPANAATLQEDSEKFLRYRAVAGCLAKNDLDSTSPTKVIDGEWFKAGLLSTNGSKLSASLLIGEDTNSAFCKDDETDDFLVESAPILGFNDTGSMWCSIQTNANRDTEAPSGGNAFTRCVEGSGDYDVSDDDGPEQARQFTEGIKAYATGGAAFPFEPSGAMRYYIYYETFMAYCEPTREKDYIASTDKGKADTTNYVVINEVILDEAGKYKIVPALYKVSAEDGQDHNVEGVWSLPNGSPYNQKCSELAAKTWEFDDAYGEYLLANPDEAVQPGGGSGRGIDDQPCSAGALGWVICPLAEGMVNIIEQVAEILQGLLIYQPLIGSDQGNAIKAIWNLILVIANLGLVIAILIIVFSQATSVGLSNYGIKKLLPRVFAAAILMNLSFYLCAVAVDLSNILGVSVKSIVEAGMNELGALNNAGNGDVKYGAGLGQYFSVGVVGLLAAAIAIGTGAIWLLLPVLITAVMAIITALLILAARQVLITLLIIIAPLAILAWILPNTDEWFTKWRKLFTVLLMLFPIIMAVFYGAILVSAVILSAGTSTGNAINNFTIKLLAFLVLIVPLFSLPIIIKAAGGILDRFGVLVNNRNKGLIDRSRKKGTEMRGNSAFERSRAARKSETQARRSREFYESMAGDGSRRKRVLGKAGYTGMGANMLTKGGRLDARRTSDNISDMYRKQQTEATNRSLAGLVEGGAFSQGSRYRLVGANGQEILSSTSNHRDMVPAVLASRGATLQVTDVAGRTREYRGDDIQGAVASKTAQMGDVPLTESVLAMGGGNASMMREFISYNAGNYASKAPDYIKGDVGAFSDPKAAEVAGWHANTSARAATFATQRPEYARNIAASLSEALGNDNLRGDLTTGSVRNLIGQEDSAVWQALSAQEQGAVRTYLNSHGTQSPTPDTSGSGGPGPSGSGPRPGEDPMEAYAREQQANNQRNNPGNTP